MQQPGVEGQDLKAVVGQSSCLAAQRPLPQTGTSKWSPPSSPPQTEQGIPDPKAWLDPRLPQCQERWKEKQGGFLYLVLQLHDLAVLPVQLHVLVLHDFEELLDVVVLLLHESLRTGREGWRRVRSSSRPSQWCCLCNSCPGASFERHKPLNVALPFPENPRISLAGRAPQG